MTKFEKPIRPPRLREWPAPKPMPPDYTPVLRLATEDTATRYGVNPRTIRKWQTEWAKLPLSRRNYDLQEGNQP